jgi:hypothetical protein
MLPRAFIKSRGGATPIAVDVTLRRHLYTVDHDAPVQPREPPRTAINTIKKSTIDVRDARDDTDPFAA